MIAANLSDKVVKDMTQAPAAPVVLVILDGWGYRPEMAGNAIGTANTPIMDSLWDAYPHTLISTSGRAVGLPDGQMGNSEVGHINIGAGRIVPQELVRISDAVQDRSLLQNPALQKVCAKVRTAGGKLHLMGLCSDGGVHAHLSHLFGLIDLAKAEGIDQLCIHGITDGRDTNPKDGLQSMQKLQAYLDEAGVGKIVTVSGRYYAMDRDNRWDRVAAAYGVMTTDSAGTGQTVEELLLASYEAGVTDEFITPTRLLPGAIEDGDGVIFFNFRPDRARQLTSAFVQPDFRGFDRSLRALSFATFTQYDSELPVLVAFEPTAHTNILAEIISKQGWKQFRTAETEKYAHVTYFFNGGEETEFPGEVRELVPSPMVSTFDKMPAMSAAAVTDVVLAALARKEYALIVVNYANPDMVGHTGKMAETVQAVEVVDHCLGRLVEAIGRSGGTAIITADHGNAEYMCDAQGNPWTAHTTNQVPFILIEGEKLSLPGHGNDVQLREDGKLADIAPTILQILGLPKPSEMTGVSMVLPVEIDVKPNRTPIRVGV
jgi:2,3-bisphosphoglycerate-independent phosphoglycerate mutase